MSYLLIRGRYYESDRKRVRTDNSDPRTGPEEIYSGSPASIPEAFKAAGFYPSTVGSVGAIEKIFAGSLLGYRNYILIANRGIYPLIPDHRCYSAKVVEKAECYLRPYHADHADYAVPAPDCSCGLYSYWDYHDTILPHILGGTGVVEAVVEIYGRIIPADYGSRAEYQKILALLFPLTARPKMLRYYRSEGVFCTRSRIRFIRRRALIRKQYEYSISR
jgi:hypothetical protein